METHLENTRAYLKHCQVLGSVLAGCPQAGRTINKEFKFY